MSVSRCIEGFIWTYAWIHLHMPVCDMRRSLLLDHLDFTAAGTAHRYKTIELQISRRLQARQADPDECPCRGGRRISRYPRPTIWPPEPRAHTLSPRNGGRKIHIRSRRHRFMVRRPTLAKHTAAPVRSEKHNKSQDTRRPHPGSSP